MMMVMKKLGTRMRDSAKRTSNERESSLSQFRPGRQVQVKSSSTV